MRRPCTLSVAVALFTLATLWPSAAAAQQRPFTTEDPEAIGAGRIMLESGLDYDRFVTFSSSALGHGSKPPRLTP